MALTWRVGEDAAGQRVDRALAEHLDQTRSRVRRWILAGRVQRQGEGLIKPSARLEAGDLLLVEEEEPADPRIVAEAGPLAPLYEDADLLVLDKPAGLAVHPGAGRSSGTLANRLLYRYPQLASVGGPGRPGIVHRLDKDTTGVLAVALGERAFRHLSAAFAERRVEKIYLAIVYGVPRPEEGRIELPIARHRSERKKMAVRSRGRSALTLYRTVASAEGLSLLELGLATGRTHQIRVHLKALGHPLVGDPVYGEARWRGLPRRTHAPLERFPRPALHAWSLAFEHPRSQRRVRFEAEVPEDMRSLWSAVTRRPWPPSEAFSRGRGQAAPGEDGKKISGG